MLLAANILSGRKVTFRTEKSLAHPPVSQFVLFS
jgi:hypothetical protein